MSKYKIEPRTFTAKIVVYPTEDMSEEITFYNTGQGLKDNTYDIDLVMPYDNTPTITLRPKKHE